MSSELVMDVLKPNGEKAWGVKCSLCKRTETSTPEEGKTRFSRSMLDAGWKWKTAGGGRWVCFRCELGEE